MKQLKIIIIILLIIFIFILPNISNKKEDAVYDAQTRMDYAKKNYNIAHLKDSIKIAPCSYYADHSEFYQKFLGKGYRQTWGQAVTMKVFDINEFDEDFQCIKIGGGSQTTSLKFSNADGCIYSLRSVNKDAQGMVSAFWQYTPLRLLLRDQISALMPYGRLMVTPLYRALNIPSQNPKLYFIPYDPAMDESCQKEMAGNVAILDLDWDEQNPCTDSLIRGNIIGKTGDMLLYADTYNIHIDTGQFLMCRLLDIMIGDFDRHNGNWAWMRHHSSQQAAIQAIPQDRDAAFAKFGGIFSNIVKVFYTKFQPYKPDIEDIEGYLINRPSFEPDFFADVSKTTWQQAATQMQKNLTGKVLTEAIQQIPPEVGQEVKNEIFETMQYRRDHLLQIAEQLYDIYHTAQK